MKSSRKTNTIKQLGRLIISTLLMTTLFLTPISASDSDDANYDYALKLKELGIFVGSDKGFELNRVPTRIEGIVMLVRLLGKEKEALTLSNNSTVFKDVPDWARGYVNYAKAKGLTNGISATLFGSNDSMDATQYVTFLLRSLGYSDAKGDFVWSKSLDKGKSIGLISSTSTYTNKTFIRSHIAKLSYDALTTLYKNSNTSLAQYLINLGAINEATAVAIGVVDNPAVVNGKLYALKDASFYALGENDCYVDVIASASISNAVKPDVYVHLGNEDVASHSLLTLPIDGYDKFIIRIVQEEANANNTLSVFDGNVTTISKAKTTSAVKTYTITENSSLVTIDLSTFKSSYITLYLDVYDSGKIFIYNLYLD